MALLIPPSSQVRYAELARESVRLRQEAQEIGRFNRAVNRRMRLTLGQVRRHRETRTELEAGPKPTGDAEPVPPTDKARLLIAEDEPSLWPFLGEVLGEQYEVEVTTNGVQAWEAAQRQAPDLVLSNVRMPGMDGLALTRRLRAHPPTALVPIILLSAGSREELLLPGLRSGADDVLAKPFRWGELRKVLGDWSKQ